MDRVLPAHVRRSAYQALGLRLVVALAGALGLVAAARWALVPSVRRSQLRTAVVDVGPLEETVMAAGTVVPQFEEVVSSPIDARVLRLLQRPGAQLTRGQPILELDASAQQLKVDGLDKDLALKESGAAKARLELQTSLGSLQSQIEIKKLQLAAFGQAAARNRKLYEQRLIWTETWEQGELDVARTTLELMQLKQALALARRAAQAQLRGTGAEMATLRKERVSAQHDLELATARAGLRGTLSLVAVEPGATVHKGDVLARVADLSSYRVQATLSDVHASRLAQGQPAQVQLGETVLEGSVARVLPTIQNGAVTLEVALVEPSHRLLRSNLRVDVHVVLDRRPRTLRLEKGVALGDGKDAQVFVVRGGTAVRTAVRFGLTGTERQEVLGGLQPGDEVVLSDLRDFQNVKSLAIR